MTVPNANSQIAMQKSGTSLPLNNYKNKHPRELEEYFKKRSPDQQEVTSLFNATANAEKFNEKEKLAIAFCMGKHSLPFSFFDDKVMRWGFGITYCGHTVRRSVEDLHARIQESVNEALKNII